jgi:hypothetical protein
MSKSSDGNFAQDDPRDPSTEVEGDAWVTEDDVKALAVERDVFGEDELLQAERVLKENLPGAVHSVAKLARTAASETVRLNASKYLIDRNLGKITEIQPDEDDALKRLYEDVKVTTQAE